MKNIDAKLRDNAIWKETYSIVEHIYGILEEIADNHPDEKWTTVSKLRSSANDSMFHTSQAIANYNGESSVFDWNSARKNLFALQAMYIFAGKHKFLDLDPHFIVRIDKLLSKFDEGYVAAEKEVQKQKQTEMEPWLERYRMWQDMQDK